MQCLPQKGTFTLFDWWRTSRFAYGSFISQSFAEIVYHIGGICQAIRVCSSNCAKHVDVGKSKRGNVVRSEHVFHCVVFRTTPISVRLRLIGVSETTGQVANNVCRPRMNAVSEMFPHSNWCNSQQTINTCSDSRMKFCCAHSAWRFSTHFVAQNCG